jgi:deoxyadenosine/deoxycytidine kinase
MPPHTPAKSTHPQIVIVGPCGSGKSTLAEALRLLGLDARQVAQEHSFSPRMWQYIRNPDILIYLDASYETCTKRKKIKWFRHEYAKQVHRLQHARKHCHFYIDTEGLTSKEVLTQVKRYLSILT